MVVLTGWAWSWGESSSRRLVFVALLRCGRLPFASQLGWLGLLRHGADIGQTQLLRRESRAAVLPPPLVLLGKWQEGLFQPRSPEIRHFHEGNRHDKKSNSAVQIIPRMLTATALRRS